MKRLVFPVAIVTLLILLLALFGVACAKLDRAANAVEALWQSQLASAQSALEEAQLTLEKALLSSDPALKGAYLMAVRRYADQADAALGASSMEMDVAAPALALVKQLSDRSSALAQTLLAGEAVSDADAAYLTASSEACARLIDQLSLARAQCTSDGGSAQQAREPDPATIPVMEHDQPLGLPNVPVTHEEALVLAAQAVGADRVTRVQSGADASGVLPAHGIIVDTNDLRLNVEITKNGGKLLMMMPETASFQPLHTSGDCSEAAGRYLEAMGFPEMRQVSWQVYDGLLVAAFVPLQEGVLLYPDMLHVQVRMDTMEVVGFEAVGYWTYHVQRMLPDAALSPEEASRLVSAHATVDAVRLCLLALQGQERLCYEVSAESGGEHYYIYLDADTGREVSVRKLLMTPNGLLSA